VSLSKQKSRVWLLVNILVGSASFCSHQPSYFTSKQKLTLIPNQDTQLERSDNKCNGTIPLSTPVHLRTRQNDPVNPSESRCRPLDLHGWDLSSIQKILSQRREQIQTQLSKAWSCLQLCAVPSDLKNLWVEIWFNLSLSETSSITDHL
jgi:hypothetical protein